MMWASVSMSARASLARQRGQTVYSGACTMAIIAAWPGLASWNDECNDAVSSGVGCDSIQIVLIASCNPITSHHHLDSLSISFDFVLHTAMSETEQHRPPGRTASRIALDLSQLSLPEPSAITDAAKRSEQESKVRELNNQLAKLDLDEPSALSQEEREMEKERVREALLQVISAMELGEPEEVLRANLRADGKKTPDKMCVFSFPSPRHR
jgi:hypothetical protein